LSVVDQSGLGYDNVFVFQLL